MQIPRIDPKNAAGLVDKIVGLGKEIVGTVASNERLTKAGQIQQEKGTERLKAIQSEIDADAHKAKAKSAEASQKSAQTTKEKVSS